METEQVTGRDQIPAATPIEGQLTGGEQALTRRNPPRTSIAKQPKQAKRRGHGWSATSQPETPDGSDDSPTDYVILTSDEEAVPAKQQPRRTTAGNHSPTTLSESRRLVSEPFPLLGNPSLLIPS